MKPFWAIVHLTIRNALRSHIFQLLLALLLICVVAVPNTIAGDGTAQGYIQVSLKYSLAAVAVILSLSSVWLGCFSMTQDVESYQLHLVVTKPVSRVTVWLAKWAGVAMVHVTLLLVAALAIYFTVLWQFSQQGFSQEEYQRIEHEVLVGRRVFMPDVTELRQDIEQKIDAKKADDQRTGTELNAQLIGALRRQLYAASQEVQYRQRKQWNYSGLPPDYSGPIFVRYRLYVTESLNSNDQRQTQGSWVYYRPERVFDRSANAGEAAILRGYNWLPEQRPPTQIIGGIFSEFELSGDYIAPDGTVQLGYINLDNYLQQGNDVEHASQFFQISDGPRLMIAVSGFAENYSRAVIVLVLQILLYTGLGCAAASFFSLPTAIFVVLSYLVFGSVATYMADATFLSGAGDYIAYAVGTALLLVVIPMQNFEVTHFVSNGELVEFALIGKLFLSFFVLRGIPFFLLGIFCYWKRELGLVIRK